MHIEITMTDVKRIANESLQGGGVKTELEIALAKKCLQFHEKLVEVNNQRNEFLEGLYSAFLRIEKAGGEALKGKRLADMEANRTAALKRAQKIENELKGIINNGTGESKYSGGNGEA